MHNEDLEQLCASWQ